MPNRYLDPEGLARVGNMELVAKQVVEGFITGRHRSPFHGFSAEYLDHRAYAPGDQVDTIDWKLLARIAVGVGPHGLTYFPQPGRYSLGHTGNYR